MFFPNNLDGISNDDSYPCDSNAKLDTVNESVSESYSQVNVPFVYPNSYGMSYECICPWHETVYVAQYVLYSISATLQDASTVSPQFLHVYVAIGDPDKAPEEWRNA